MKINKGQLLERAVRRSALSLSDIARGLRVNRRSLYNWFKHEELSESIFLKVGQIINYDFFAEFPDLFPGGSELSIAGFKSNSGIGSEASTGSKNRESLKNRYELPSGDKSKSGKDTIGNPQRKTEKEAAISDAYWKDKYIELLERYSDLLSDKKPKP